MACVPTLIAPSEPPKSHTKMSEGWSADCAFEASSWSGRCRKNTSSTTFTDDCSSIAKTVGIASFRIVDVLFAEKSMLPVVAPAIRSQAQLARLVDNPNASGANR